MDDAVPLGVFPRGSRGGADHGVVLHPDGAVLRRKPRPRAADQRAVLVRVQPGDLRGAGQLPADGGGARGRRVVARGERGAHQRGPWPVAGGGHSHACADRGRGVGGFWMGCCRGRF